MRSTHLCTVSILLCVMLGASPALAQSITGVAATDSNIDITLSNAGAASVKIYPVGIYEDYNSASPGTAVYTGAGAGNISVSRFCGDVDRMYMGFQLANGSTNAAIGSPQHVTDVSSVTASTDSFEGWLPTGRGASAAVSSGQINMTFAQPTSYGFDPNFSSPALIDASTNTYLSMRVKLVNSETSTMTMGVYCFSPTDAGHGSSSFTITQSASWQTLSFDLTNITGPYISWTGDRYLRFDPADGAANAYLYDTATFDIDWIAVTDDASFDGTNPDADDFFTDFTVDRSSAFTLPSSKKGLQVQMVDDAVDLGNKWAGLNVLVSSVVTWNDTEPLLVREVDGYDIPINTGYLISLDKQIAELTANGMTCVLILTNGVPTSDDGSPMIHPDTDLANAPNHLGAFNLVEASGYRHYRAAMEILAERYSVPNGISGQAPWIVVGNEINSHWWWHNIGETSITNMCADYVKALRVTDLALRSYHEDMRAMVSLEHHWNIAYSTSTRSGKGKDVVAYVDQYVDERGDFPWGVAYHPYPENLFDPEFWLDTSTSFTLTTDRITMDNIEILPAIMRQPDYLYDGELRDIMLTEQGFHGPDTTAGQDTQAAAYCYAYKKVDETDGIKSFILHRHVDHGLEGGLLLGLWTRDTSDPFPATPLNEKDAYWCFKYADTASWATYFNPYLANLPFSTWDGASPVPTSVNYHFDTDTEGYTAAQQITGLAASGGILTGATTGGDPFMRGETLWVLGDTVNTLYISMRTSAGSTGQIYWTTTDEPYESEPKSKSFTLTSNGAYQLYTLDMSTHSYWAGEEILSLRVDPVRTSSVDFGIDFIVDDWQVLLPRAPSGLSASGYSTSQINVSWTDSATNETGYAIERSANGASGWTEISDLLANTTSYSDTGLSSDTTYYYRVRAYSADGYTGYSNVDAGATLTPLPSAPTSLGATAASPSAINLAWTDNATNETGFKIERSTDGSNYAQIDTTGANVTTYGDTGLSANTNYYYRVRAYNGTGDSSYSNVDSATTLNTPPGAPSGLSAAATSTSAISLSWTDNASDESGFKIERSSDSVTFTQIDTAAANATSYNSTSLASNTTYWYRVRAYNAVGDSDYSNTAVATTQGSPTYKIEYNFTSTTEGWSAIHDLNTLSVSGGAVTTSSTGADP